ncbi:hypothetical protein DL96DRAFT_1585936 [Flagelloscypha sp. PMI_526]|nr:hypothetical protein DL96DRAFT_1585936 [Flagelloscypha sp. PMI_526]
MSSSEDKPIPVFPPELEFKIFRTCYFSTPKELPVLLSVCQRVYQWQAYLLGGIFPVDHIQLHRLNAIKYFSVKLSEESDTQRMQAWLKTQPPHLIRENVRAILVHFPDSSLYPAIQAILLTCTGVQYLGLWLHLAPSDRIPLDDLLRASLKCLDHIQHLSLSPAAEGQLNRILGAQNLWGNEGGSRNVKLRSIDWGLYPALPLDTFPSVDYAVIQGQWPLSVDHMRKMDEWLSRPSSKGLILLIDHKETAYLELSGDMETRSAILQNEKVVVVSCPSDWVKDWESHVFGDGNDIFAVGKRLVGHPESKDRMALGKLDSYEN